MEALLAACTAPEWVSQNEVRLVVVSAPISFETLRELALQNDVFARQTDLATQALYDDGSPGVVRVGDSFTLILPRVVSRSVVARNLADLLSLSSATWTLPTAYFLITEEQSQRSFCFIEDECLRSASRLVIRYHDAVKLWALVRNQAEHRTENETLMFFGVRRTVLMPLFDIHDLQDDIALNEINDFLTNQDRHETRATIFHSVVSEFLRDRKPEESFAYLLRTSGLFARRLTEALAIFLSTNSPERLTEEAVAKHFELAEKLERVITGMEAKSLSIPAAVLIAIKEVHFGERWVALNTVILASAALYLAAMTVAYFSQRAMLKLLGETIDKAVKDLRDQGLNETNPVLAVSFASLRRRLQNSQVGSLAMWIFSTVPLISVLYAGFIAPIPPKPTVTDLSVQTALELVAARIRSA